MPSADPHAKDHLRYNQRKAAGLCVQHGCPRRPDDGYVYCEQCRMKRGTRRYGAWVGKGPSSLDYVHRTNTFDTSNHERSVKNHYAAKALVDGKWIRLGYFASASDAKAAMIEHSKETGLKFRKGNYKIRTKGWTLESGLFD